MRTVRPDGSPLRKRPLPVYCGYWEMANHYNHGGFAPCGACSACVAEAEKVARTLRFLETNGL